MKREFIFYGFLGLDENVTSRFWTELFHDLESAIEAATEHVMRSNCFPKMRVVSLTFSIKSSDMAEVMRNSIAMGPGFPLEPMVKVHAIVERSVSIKHVDPSAPLLRIEPIHEPGGYP